MTDSASTPYGSWKSPITSDLIASRAVGLEQIAVDGEDIYWTEMRPEEGGRCVLVRRTPDGMIRDVTPQPYNVRTRVHEYGGGAFAVDRGVVFFSNFSDQRLYRQSDGNAPVAVTPEGSMRFADASVDRIRNRLVCICEDHSDDSREAVNTLASIDLVGGDGVQALVSGNDFYSSPRLSPDGSRLAWLTWNHPQMPWDGCELWSAELNTGGIPVHAQRIAGGANESIFQPEWSPDGALHFVSDRTGWWNLYRWRGGEVEPMVEMEAEFGVPQWVLGMSTYAFESGKSLICACVERGTWQLGRLDTETGHLDPLQVPYSQIAFLRVSPEGFLFVGGSPTEPSCVVLMRPSGRVETLRRSHDIDIDPGYLSSPEAIEFPTEGGRNAYAFFYPPRNREYDDQPQEEPPPLLVMSHGGPTAMATGALNLRVQFWTSRGIAVVDVNYGGSTGYGKAYRQRLDGQWGVVDVHDCVHAAKYLSQRSDVDANRLAIRGSSAGGYTALCALTFRRIFKAGASYYGVSDLEALLRETHKFESQYEKRLIGPYPERRDLYRNRSPIHFVQELSSPVIFFQGLQDKVVPPNQAEAMISALRKKGIPVGYVTFQDEQHGFRRSENIKRALEAELYFYSKIFAFDLADDIEPVPIENL